MDAPDAIRMQVDEVTIERGGRLDARAAASLTLPTYTNDDRPLADASLEGCIIYNRTAGRIELCDGQRWLSVPASVEPSAGILRLPLPGR